MANWTGTNSGRRIDLANPSMDEIEINDIAIGLANTCRFGGQISRWYSVAEHSIKVSRMVPPEMRLIALLHDATEAYICDIPTPLKAELGHAYAEIENRLALVIGHKFGLGDALAYLPPAVKQADRAVLMAERDALQGVVSDWGHDYEMSMRYPAFHVEYSTAADAKAAFHGRFTELYKGNR